MRTMVFTVVSLTVLVTSAAAQPAPPFADTPPPPPINPSDMPNFCVYENKIYSLGAGLCLGRSSYVCVPSPGPATGNRAFWTNKEDQIFSRPQCN